MRACQTQWKFCMCMISKDLLDQHKINENVFCLHACRTNIKMLLIKDMFLNK